MSSPYKVKYPSKHGPMLTLLVFLVVCIGGAGVWLLVRDTSGTARDMQTDALVESESQADAAMVSNEKPLEDSMANSTASRLVPSQEDGDFPELSVVELPVDEKSQEDYPEIASQFEKETPLILLRHESTSHTARERDAALLAKAQESNAWDEYRDFLAASLRNALQSEADDLRRRGFDSLWKESVFSQVLLRWCVLESLPTTSIRTDQRDASPLVGWMMENNDAMHEWLLTIKPEDNLPRAMELLYDLWYGDPPQFEKYFNLALACALVFDREVRVQHPPKASGSIDRVVIDPLQRFLWYAEKNEESKLANRIHEMPARDLVWVVCVPISIEEMEWAVAKMRLRRGRWGEAFGMIQYLMERAVSGVNPYSEYTFAEILKHGGICGDQTYFCVNTARANGIPAIPLSGETDLGPHAWAALQLNPGEWSTMTGRIGGVANGRGGNPQTGGQISEQEIWLWSERDYRSTASLVSIFRLHWLADVMARTLGDEGLVETAVRQANREGRNVPETWGRLHELLAAKTREAEDPGARAIVDMWTRFVSEMKAQFRDNPRMGALAGKAEDEFVFPYLEESEARRILLRERRRLERSAGEQKDLVAASLKREADLIAASGDSDAFVRISRLYSSGLRNYGDSITGFKMMAEDYFAFAKENPDEARKAVRDIELAFNRVIETGTTEWFRANTEVSIYKMIVRYYRQVGDESRANQLERRLERQFRRAERGAQ